ncbi:MAG: serine hydrolase domain-containing protein [Candidatus Cyclobacteriaceae bacterium M3_2C_046]
MIKKFLTLSIYLFLVSSCSPSTGQNYDLEDLQNYIDFRAQHGRYSGVTVIYHQDSLVFTAVNGMANRSWQVSNSLHTRFDLASVTKMFTAAGIGILLDQGRLKLNENFMHYWPDFPLPNARDITIRQLLSHTSGLTDLFFEEDYLHFDRSRLRQLSHYDRFYSQLRIRDVPEERILYSNTNFLILGRIIEKVTGTDYYEFMQENIFAPLRMENTGFFEKDDIIPGLAEGYFRDSQASMEFGVPNDGKVRRNTAIRAVKGMPAGGAYATASDMHHFIKGLQSGSLLADTTLSIFTNQVQGGYGLGFQTYRQQGIEVWGHSGGFYGVSTMVFYLPEKQLTFISLTNQDFAAQPVMDRFINRLAGQTAYEPIIIDAEDLIKYEGYFEIVSGEMLGQQLSIKAKKDHLLFDNALEFYPIGNHRLVDIDNDGFVLTFSFSKTGELLGFERGDKVRFQQRARKIDPSLIEKLQAITLPDDLLREYLLDFRFTEEGMMPGHQPEFSLQEGTLLVDNMMRFLPYQRDKFFLEDDPGMRLYFLRNDDGEIYRIKVMREKEVAGILVPIPKQE